MRSFIRLYQSYLCSLTLLLLLIATRMLWHGSLHFGFLVWNIFLALLPLFFSRGVQRLKHPAVKYACAVLWLIFFPNSAYLLTDIVHLSPRHNPLYWLDLTILFGCGLFGCAVGLRSLRNMEGWWSSFLRRRTAGMLTYAVLMVSGYGIYLGRVERWNSWDVVCSPADLALSVIYELRHPFRCIEVWALSAVFAAALLVGYTAFGRRLRW